jgi:hypothetical protein
MSENMIDALLQLAASLIALFWWWRAECWKERAMAAERECEDLEEKIQKQRRNAWVCG